MHRFIKKMPWACLSMAIQLIFVGGLGYLYYIDFGYDSGRAFSFAINLAYTLLLLTGFAGTLTTLIGMHLSMLQDSVAVLLLKYIMVYMPCLFLSVFWFYACLVLLALV